MGKKQQPAEALRSRIVGEGEEAPDQLMANPLNWRTHPKAQVDALEGLLKQVGWVQRVVVNRRTGHVVDGHARVELALRRSEPSVPVVYVDLAEAEERLVLAALDPIGGLAGTDADKLAELLADVETADQGLQAMLQELAKSTGADLAELTDQETADSLTEYSTKIEPPTYTPKGEKPPIADLFDRGKTDALLAKIDAAAVPDQVRDFLRLAAHRHIVFEYHAIAEYYCHAPADVQALMEESALVIIDFRKAIEGGYVELSKKLAAIYSSAEGDDDAGA